MTIEHNAAAGEYCPLCHAVEIEGGSVDILPQAAKQECFCEECGAEWIDYYKIDHVVIHRSGYDPTEEEVQAADQGTDPGPPDQGRPPTENEAGAIVEMFEGYHPGIIVVYDHYISDGPGYRGWLAVTVGGEPQFCESIIKDRNGHMMLASEAVA